MLKKIKLVLREWMTKLESMIAECEADNISDQKRKRRIKNVKKNSKKNLSSRNKNSGRGRK